MNSGENKMCLVCLEWQKGRLTFNEALFNLRELKFNDKLTDSEKIHLWEIEQKIKLDNFKQEWDKYFTGETKDDE